MDSQKNSETTIRLLLFSDNLQKYLGAWSICSDRSGEQSKEWAHISNFMGGGQ
jgi:hypothetical protein